MQFIVPASIAFLLPIDIGFWNDPIESDNSAVNIFPGINAPVIEYGKANTSPLQNIFFELYNEPYVDSYSDDYANNFNNYINGFSDGVNYYTGMGQSYLNIRQTKNTHNICILSAAENYAYFVLNNYYILVRIYHFSLFQSIHLSISAQF